MVYFLPTKSSSKLKSRGPNIPPKHISDTTTDASNSVTSRKNSGDIIHGSAGDDQAKQFPTPKNGRFTKNKVHIQMYIKNILVCVCVEGGGYIVPI